MFDYEQNPSYLYTFIINFISDNFMEILISTYLDYLYRELGEKIAEELLLIPPGLKILKNTGMNLFEHPHVVLWHKFLLNYFDSTYTTKPCALIMPCSSIKPYRLSAAHRVAESVLSKLGFHNFVQVYVLSEPMILVPRELDIYYPFANYDYPPSELTKKHRKMFIDILSHILPKLSYHRSIVAVLPEHHKSILIESIKRSRSKLSIEIVDYGKKAFNSIKKAIEKFTECVL